MKDIAFLCGPSGIYLYKGILFETQNTGCPLWPIREDGEPYKRLSKPMKAALIALLAMTPEEQAKHAEGTC